MFKYLRRWYRYFFNPSPMPGQFWEIAGLGDVKVNDIHRYPSRVSYQVGEEHIRRTSSLSIFRSSGTLKTNRLTGPL